LIGDAGALVQRNIAVILPRVDYVHSQSTFEQLAEPLPDLEHQIFFESPTLEILLDVATKFGINLDWIVRSDGS